MSVLDRSALEQSSLADLHVIASELGLENFRRLRKPEIIDAILTRQGGGEAGSVPAGGGQADSVSDGRGIAESVSGAAGEADAVSEGGGDADSAETDSGARRRPRRRGGRGRGRARAPETDAAEVVDRPGDAADGPADDEPPVKGVVELLGNGSGFLRVSPPDPSDDDVYVSAGQVRRCELVTGDVVTGPVRRPRRSERYPSLIRVDTINGTAADEVAEGTRYDDLPAAFPEERLALGSEDVTVRAIEWLTPFGKGSRVTIAGPSRAGKTEALRRIAGALAEAKPDSGDLQLSVVLAGVRPEEVPAWQAGPVAPVAAVSFGASPDAQTQAVEGAVEQARRLAARGADAVLLIDTLDAVAPSAARKALAAARNIAGGGSLTVIASAHAPLGGETTVIALNAALAGARRYPALDLVASGVLHPELLVGEAGAEAIAKAREEAAT